MDNTNYYSVEEETDKNPDPERKLARFVIRLFAFIHTLKLIVLGCIVLSVLIMLVRRWFSK
jgi:hypothetical protein